MGKFISEEVVSCNYGCGCYVCTNAEPYHGRYFYHKLVYLDANGKEEKVTLCGACAGQLGDSYRKVKYAMSKRGSGLHAHQLKLAYEKEVKKQ